MIVSLNEVEGACYRAGLGVGLPFGHAEEAAAAGAFLCRHHTGGVALLAAAFRAMELDRSRSAIALAPGLADRLSAALVRRIELAAVDQPLVLAAHLAARRTVRAAIAAPGWGEADVAPGRWRVRGAWQPLPAPVPLTIEARTTAFEGDAPHGQPIDAPDAEWAYLASLMRRSYVPANVRSRLSGAGAGVVDTD